MLFPLHIERLMRSLPLTQIPTVSLYQSKAENIILAINSDITYKLNSEGRDFVLLTNITNRRGILALFLFATVIGKHPVEPQLC